MTPLRTHNAALSNASLALVLLMASSCSSVNRERVCDEPSQCVRDGVQGSCVQPGFCAFEDTECDSGLRWDSTARDSFADQCVGDETGEPGDAGGRNECGGITVLTGQAGDACGVCDTGTLSCAGENAFSCDNELALEMSVTTQGDVSASAEFSSSYRATKAVDLDESTSWFSSGPEGNPTEFIWTGAQDDCFTNVKIVGNGGNSNSGFRTDFGFGEATVQVLDNSDNVVYSNSVNLDGTPDPTIDLAPNTLGRKIRLLLSGHESDDCGGFGELYITATR
jgi:hypothetical protein